MLEKKQHPCNPSNYYYYLLFFKDDTFQITYKLDRNIYDKDDRDLI